MSLLTRSRAVELAGLFVEQVDLACFAALRSSGRLAYDTEALIDLGANGTTIVIHSDGVPQSCRTVPRGGAEITKLMASRLGVSINPRGRVAQVPGRAHDQRRSRERPGRHGGGPPTHQRDPGIVQLLQLVAPGAAGHPPGPRRRSGPATGPGRTAQRFAARADLSVRPVATCARLAQRRAARRPFPVSLVRSGSIGLTLGAA